MKKSNWIEDDGQFMPGVKYRMVYTVRVNRPDYGNGPNSGVYDPKSGNLPVGMVVARKIYDTETRHLYFVPVGTEYKVLNFSFSGSSIIKTGVA